MVKRSEETILSSSSYPGKPQGFLDALSEIQQYYIIERSGTEIPRDFLTIRGTLSFFWVGLKGSLVVGFCLTILSPFAFGVMNQLIPIFGTYHPSLFDKIFAFLLPLSFSFTYSLFLITLGNYYIGGLTRAAIMSLIQGIVIGAAVKAVLAFIFFHYLYFVVFQPETLGNLILKLHFFIKPKTREKLYFWLMEFKSSLLPSAWFVVVTTVIFIGIPLASILIQGKRINRIIEEEREWGTSG